MGTFEKLGILVIVVIIVMILAVAIYQWGGNATEPLVATVDVPDPLKIVYIDDLIERTEDPPPPGPAEGDLWPGGIPKSYTIQRNDKVWVLVVKRWHLKRAFIAAIGAANPRIDMNRLLPGQKLVIPDPSSYRRGVAAEAEEASPEPGQRLYEIQTGDTLESIAFRHLGSKIRWRDIVAVNPGLNPVRLMEGQEIVIPLK